MSASTPPRLAEDTNPHINTDIPEESRIPLPPSVANSVHSGDLEAPKPEVGHIEEAIKQDIWPTEEVSSLAIVTDILEKEPSVQQDVGIIPSSEEGPKSGQNSKQDEEEAEPPLLLSELLETIRRDKYETQRQDHLRSRVNQLLHECGTAGRSLSLHSQLYPRMARCVQDDRMTIFGSLYAQSPLVSRLESSNIPQPTLAGPVRDIGLSANHPNAPIPWMHKLPSRSQRSIIEFLSSIRNDSSFLADRIAKLSSFQLNNLARPHRQQPVTDSVLRSSPSFSKLDPRSFHRHPARPSDRTPTSEELLRDPLFILIHCIFDLSSIMGSMEKFRQLDVWSSVCARVIEDGKPGSDDFCLSVVDAFAAFGRWALEPELETFLTELLDTGAFILEPEVNQMVNFKEPVEPHSTPFSVAVAEYFNRALQTLIHLLVGNLPSNYGPATGLDLIRATLDKVRDPEKRTKARNFFISRWYCASFLSNALLYPESHGIMLNFHISSAARQKILRELAIRLQKVFSDALSPWSPSILDPTLEGPVRKLIGRFDTLPQQPLVTYSGISSPPGKHYLVLGPHDVLSVATALYPEETTDSRTSSVFNRVVSGSSSITGSSTLTAGTNEPRTRTASSFAPSLSGTSFTTNSVSADPSAVHLDRSELGSYRSRPGTSGGLFGDNSKDPALSFLPDLWKLVTSGLSQGQVAKSNKELDMFFVTEPGNQLSLAQPGIICRSIHQEPVNAANSLQDGELADTMNKHDEALLTDGLLRASESHNLLDGTLVHSISNDASDLRALFHQIMTESQAGYDFQSGHFWWTCCLAVASSPRQVISNFLSCSMKAYKKSIETSQDATNCYQEWLFVLQRRKALQVKALERCLDESKALRNKMWFLSEVKHSSVYEEAMNVTRALKDMLEPSQPKQTGVTAWARQRLRSSFGQDRAQIQTLEVLAAPKDNGGPNKLRDTQVDLTTKWLLHEGIENFCRGEERIHRFCFEIQKCVKRLVGETMLESPVLWSSSLYEDERRRFGIASGQGPTYSTENPSWRTDHSYPDLLHSFQPVPSTYSHSPFPTEKPHLKYSANTENANAGPSAGLGLRNITQGSRPPIFFQSQSREITASRQWALPPSPVSPSKSRIASDITSPERQTFVENLRRTVTSFLLSDLGSLLWTNGSETDRWIVENPIPQTAGNEPCFYDTQKTNEIGEVGEFLKSPVKDAYCLLHAREGNGLPVYETDTLQEPKGTALRDDGSRSILEVSFSFAEAFEKLLRRFRLSSDPHLKLQSLYEVVQLVNSRTQSSGLHLDPYQSHKSEDPFFEDMKSNRMPGVGIPRTRLTRLQEVVANCEERRLATLSKESINGMSKQPPNHLFISRKDDPTALAAVRCIFSSPWYRHSTFFRDLQYIASFVPSSLLDHTPQGTAFWTVALAAMSIKSAMCKSMTSRATQIVAYYYESNNMKEPTRAGQASHRSQEDIGPILSQEDLTKTTLGDAARLYSIAALEGEPLAARELALFYLTHPELVPLVTLPLSKTSEVFRASLGAGVEKGHRPAGDSSGLDPKVFAVAFHWMELAANAGDADAIAFLRENGDLRLDR